MLSTADAVAEPSRTVLTPSPASSATVVVRRHRKPRARTWALAGAFFASVSVAALVPVVFAVVEPLVQSEEAEVLPVDKEGAAASPVAESVVVDHDSDAQKSARERKKAEKKKKFRKVRRTSKAKARRTVERRRAAQARFAEARIAEARVAEARAAETARQLEVVRAKQAEQEQAKEQALLAAEAKQKALGAVRTRVAELKAKAKAKGVRADDVAGWRGLLRAATVKAKAGDEAGAQAQLGQAESRLAKVQVDRRFVEKKLLRFNRAFDQAPSSRRAALVKKARRVRKALKAGKPARANRALNEAFSLLSSPRS